MMKQVFVYVLPIGLIWMLFQAAGISFLTFAPAYFVSGGYSVQIATFLTSIWMFGSLLLSPIMGRVLDRTGNETFFVLASSLLLTGMFLVFPLFIEQSLVMMIFMAVLATVIPVSVFTMTPKKLEPHQTGLGFSIIANFTSVGLVIGPLATGLITDVYQSYSISFIAMAIFMALSAVVSIGLRNYTPSKPT